MSEGQVALGWLAFNKFGKSIVELIEGDAARDEKSSRQPMSVKRAFSLLWGIAPLELAVNVV
jgi:hypothetical protein